MHMCSLEVIYIDRQTPLLLGKREIGLATLSIDGREARDQELSGNPFPTGCSAEVLVASGELDAS